MNSLKKYSLLILIAMLVSACANRASFEWIKINPDKIKEANTRVAYRNGIRNIDLTIELKEKTIPIYYESPEAFEAGNSVPLIITKPEMVSKPSFKRKVVNRPSIKTKKTIAPKPIYSKPIELKKIIPKKSSPDQPVAVKKTSIYNPAKIVDSINPEEEKIALDKLNGALKIPKKPVKQIIGKQKETTPNKTEVEKVLSSKQKTVLINPVAKSNLNVAKKIIQTEVKPIIEKKDKVKEFLNARKGNSFILAGAALAVIGVVLGLIFGKSAYLVSGAGIIFAAVGVFLKF